VKIGSAVRAGRRIEKKDITGQDMTVKKLIKWQYFAYMGRSPTVRIRTQICTVGSFPSLITYAKFQVKTFRGCDFTEVEFPIFLLIFAWALQQCSVMQIWLSGMSLTDFVIVESLGHRPLNSSLNFLMPVNLL